nr:zinc finger, CCHC-type [Tanacetum cinerariifolium]
MAKETIPLVKTYDRGSKETQLKKEKPPQNSDIRQLIREECGIRVCEKQKQNMEDTLLELLEDCRQKEFYIMHNDVNDLIESALNSKLFSINLRSQRLNKKKQEVKNIVEQPTKRGTRIVESLQNFRVKKNSTSLNNTSRISSVNAITTVLPTEEPEHSLSMGYEHLSTSPKTNLDEVIKSSVKKLVPIPSEYEVTFDNESECDVPVKDESFLVFTTFSNPIFDDNDDFTSSDDELLFSEKDVLMKDFKVYSNPLFDDDEINSDEIDPKFDDFGKGVIICLYVDDMLIFGTDQNQVDETKKLLSSRFLMKDMGEANVILCIKIKRENKGIVIMQSRYIKKILKKFNREDCSPVSTLMNLVEKLKPNTGKPVDQLEYSRAIGCLMYDMTSTRPYIAYDVGRLSRFTSNPSRQHWKVITKVLKYLRGTKDYGLSYVGYPSVLEGYSVLEAYSDAS